MLIKKADLLKHINFEDYDWYIDNIEVYTRDGQDAGWNYDSPVSGQNIRRIFNDQYSLIFGEFIGFPSGADASKPNTYEEFVNSSAEIVILVVDAYYHDVYCKSASLIEVLYKDLIRLGADEVAYIDENDPRYKLSVW